MRCSCPAMFNVSFMFLVLYLTASCPTMATGSHDQKSHVEAPIVLKAADILPEKWLKGRNFSVVDRVSNDGLINTYQLTTRYGPLTVESTELLRVRIGELNAMAVIEEMDRQKIFGDSLVSGIKAPFQGMANLVMDPVETSKDVVEGAGRFFSNIGRAIVSDDPHQDNALKVAVGYDAAKRAFAYELGINPYSSYEPVMSELGDIATASVSGGLLPRAAMAAVGGDVVAVLQLSGTSEGLRKLVRDNPPGELEKLNRSKLASMGVAPRIADSFLNNHLYDPQEKTFLVGELARLGDVTGRDAFVAAAALVSRPTLAVFYRATAALMARYDEKISPVSGMGRVAGMPYIRKGDGALVVLLPLDYVFRTASFETKLQSLERELARLNGVTAREMWFTGRVDDAARTMFEAYGWSVTENADQKLGL